MALAVDAITDKTATGQHRGLEAAQKRIADSWAAAEALRLLKVEADFQSEPETPQQFHSRCASASSS
jgi:hypothetical protein